MQYPRLRNDRFPQTGHHHEGTSSRMTSYKSIKTVTYSPYPDEDKTPTHVIHKVTSKINNIFQDLRSAVGSIFKSSPDNMKQSSKPENNPPKTGLTYPNASNQAIMNIDFQGLGSLLTPTNPMFTSFGGQQSEVNALELSFGDHEKKQNDSSGNQTLFSFRPTTKNLNNISDSRIIETLDLNGSGFEQDNHGPKLNILRILNFCHVLYENTKERYTKTKPYGTSLRSALVKGLPKPIPLRSTTPLIEFKYNKVSGKYEAHSSFKKKKRTSNDVDPDFDLKEHMLLSTTMVSEDQNKLEHHAYKKKKVNMLPKTNEPKILVDLKKYKKKPLPSNAPSKKSASSYGTTLETYETDETEEHELRKESPYKNKVFEEDKEDYLTKAFTANEESRKSDKKRSPISSPIKGGKDSITSKDGTAASNNPFTPPTRSQKTTPEKIDTKQNEKYQNLKITPVNDQSFSNPNFSLNDSKTSETSDAQKDPENILNLPKTPTFNHNPKNSLFMNSSKSEDSIEQAPESIETPAPKSFSLFSQLSTSKPSGGLFGPAATSENKVTTPAFNNNGNMSFSDEPQTQAQPEPETQKEEVAPVVETNNVDNPPVQQQETKVIPDFLKAYQRSASVVSNTENNPFLSKSAGQSGNSNPFLQPAKIEAPMMSFLGNNNTVTSSNQNQAPVLSTATATLGLFNTQPQQNSVSLFGNNNNNNNNNGMIFHQNSPAPHLESNSNSNGGSLWNKSENSNGFDNNRGINVFHNNFQNENEMEKESSMGFQNNLFASKFNNNNNGASEQKSNNLFGNLNNNNNNNFSSMNNGGGNPLFSNNMSNTNSLFASDNSSQTNNFGLFNGNNNNSNSSNNFLSPPSINQSNNNISPFLNNNNTNNNSFLSPPQENKKSFIGMQSSPSMGQQTQAASNFLGIGGNNNNSPAPQQERVFRKIIMPGSGNKKERAF